MSKQEFKPEHESQLVLSYCDIITLLKKKWHWIVASMLTSIALIVAYKLTRPIEYIVTATFHEKAKATGMEVSGLNFLNLGSSDSEATAWMKSRKLMENLVRHMDLQAVVVQKQPTDSLFGRIKTNISIEYAAYKGKEIPSNPRFAPEIVLKNIVYHPETSTALTLVFNNENDFTAYDDQDKLLGRGSIGIPFALGQNSFTVTKQPEVSVNQRTYKVALLSLLSVANNLLQHIKVELDSDGTLLKITCANCDRHHAAKIVNTMMALYQEHLRDEQMRVAQEQIGYLQNRQTTMAVKLRKMLADHAESLSADLGNTGFATTEKAMEFIAATQLEYRRTLNKLEMESRRLRKGLEGDEVALESFVGDVNHSQIMHLVGQIRDLKQQADTMDIALRTPYHTNLGDLQNVFITQLGELDRVQKQKSEAKEILAVLEKGRLPTGNTTLHNDDRFTVGAWQIRLEGLVDHATPSPQNDRELANCYEGFCSYTRNLLHLLDVHERTIQEQVRYQQSAKNDFQGINLATAHELYLAYCREMHQIEASLLQHQHVIKQMEDPQFEICSLGMLLDDPVSREMVSKASRTTLSLKDSNNRSTREQDRLREEMLVQKNFLTMHIDQTIQLLMIRYELVKQKIYDLQNVNLGLVHQKISILERHLIDYINSRITSLNHERELITQHQEELHQELTRLPTKWVSEKLIVLEMEANQRMIDEISRLVETKNIGSNLEVVQSAPVDAAVPPLYPKRLNLLLFSTAAALLGGFAAFAGLLIKSAAQGIEATPENLTAYGQNMLGTWSASFGKNDSKNLTDHDLAILRRLIAFSNQNLNDSTTAQTLLAIKGNGIDFTFAFAKLLAIQGKKVIRVPLNFEQADSSKGLLQFLQGEVAKPEIIEEEGVFHIPMGGFSRYAHELIASQKFTKLYADLQAQYDWILLVSSETAESSEAQTLAQQFTPAVIQLQTTKLETLAPLFSRSNAFVFLKAES